MSNGVSRLNQTNLPVTGEGGGLESVNFFHKESGGEGSGVGGARVSDFFFHKESKSKKKTFFFGGGGGGGV